MTVPGKHERQYFGLYSVVEDMDKRFIQSRYQSKAGALFKPVTRQLFEYLGDDWEKYEQPYDAKGKITALQKQRVIDFARLVSHTPDPESAARVGEFTSARRLSLWPIFSASGKAKMSTCSACEFPPARTYPRFSPK